MCVSVCLYEALHPLHTLHIRPGALCHTKRPMEIDGRQLDGLQQLPAVTCTSFADAVTGQQICNCQFNNYRTDL